MIAVELPGVWGGAAATTRATEREHAAAVAAARTVERAARLDLAVALTRHRSAVDHRAHMVAELVPAAERALDVARRALGTPQGSVPAVLMALRAVADVRQQQVMADAEVRTG
jgi:hypothetical protein